MADKAIKELREEILHVQASGGPVSNATLAIATNNLNSVIKHLGRSAKELFMSHNQNSGENIPLIYTEISERHQHARTFSHLSSAQHKADHGKPVSLTEVKTGDLIYIKSDMSKSKKRDQFIIHSVNPETKTATIQKFLCLKQNPLTVQLWNLFKAYTEDAESNHSEDQIEHTDTNREPKDPHTVSIVCPTHQKFHTQSQIINWPEESNDSSDSEEYEIEEDHVLHPPPQRMRRLSFPSLPQKTRRLLFPILPQRMRRLLFPILPQRMRRLSLPLPTS